MQYHWLKDRANLGQFYTYWEKGKKNLGDFYMKHHPPWHQAEMRPIVLNNPPVTKYYSGKGVLITPRTRRRHTPDVITKTAVNVKMTVIYQSKLWREYLNRVRQFRDVNPEPKVDQLASSHKLI